MCNNISNLFDESVTGAADSANLQDFGAADEADLTGVLPLSHILPQLGIKLCPDMAWSFATDFALLF